VAPPALPHGLDWPLRFGIFLAPFHPTGQNPTLALERDLELIRRLDELGFDEAWIGEHHSAGYELIASPEVFIAFAAERTRRIRLGTGVSSLPYHHPLLLADRMVLLDHLTRGRVMLGVGPGQLTSDAHMLGIEPLRQRPMMEESLEAIVALLAGDEPVTRHTDWFTLQDARLQLRPYTHPRFEIAVAATISPAGPRAAGRFGLGLLSIAATQQQAFDLLGGHWEVMEERAEEFGTSVDRRRWRLVGPMHLAETEAEARRDVRFGLEDFGRYFRHILPVDPTGGADDLDAMLDYLISSGFAVVGTPDMAVAQLERLVKQSGGFGTFLVFAHEWADREATLRSYELFARAVMPRFQGSLVAPEASEAWVRSSGGRFVQAAANAIGQAMSEHYREREGRDSPT
jgi:limonene 1,2-monooxygenase